MENSIRKEWDFIIVPLEAEFSETQINQSWYHKEKIN